MARPCFVTVTTKAGGKRPVTKGVNTPVQHIAVEAISEAVSAEAVSPPVRPTLKMCFRLPTGRKQGPPLEGPVWPSLVRTEDAHGALITLGLCHPKLGAYRTRSSTAVGFRRPVALGRQTAQPARQAGEREVVDTIPYVV